MATKKPIKKSKDILGPFSPFDNEADKNRKRMEREDRLAMDQATQEGYSKGSAYQSRLAKGSPSAGTRGSRPQSANANLWQGATNNGYTRARQEMLEGKGRRIAAAGKAAQQMKKDAAKKYSREEPKKK